MMYRDVVYMEGLPVGARLSQEKPEFHMVWKKVIQELLFNLILWNDYKLKFSVETTEPFDWPECGDVLQWDQAVCGVYDEGVLRSGLAVRVGHQLHVLHAHHPVGQRRLRFGRACHCDIVIMSLTFDDYTSFTFTPLSVTVSVLGNQKSFTVSDCHYPMIFSIRRSFLGQKTVTVVGLSF